jgi:predicted nucleic acid-binding protein
VCGPVESEPARLAAKVLGEAVSFSSADSELAASLFNTSGRRRGSLLDCMIAATAIHAGAVLATVDRAHFERFCSAGLELTP